uniref:Photosystem II reaction center protein Z n=1 Tax=Acrochaetium secundatum TaxID=209631 RepID=A0A4D6BN98_9FLOR|nr:photosystem II protein Z [Acrochaetium secundatum]QBX88423.1 photosystem II protein Z [Acrochaetium secundatum]
MYKKGVLMSLILEFLVFALIILSTILVVSIPVTLASPGQWEQSKNLVYTGSGLWAGLVIITGVVNSFIA